MKKLIEKCTPAGCEKRPVGWNKRTVVGGICLAAILIAKCYGLIDTETFVGLSAIVAIMTKVSLTAGT
jgi:hypothetical protein